MLGNASFASLTQPSLAERGRNADDLTHFFRMADRTLHRHAAAQAVTDDVRAWDLEIIEQRGHIVGEVFIADIAFDVGRAPVALHFDGDHFPRFGKFADPVRRSVTPWSCPVVCNCHERAVEQHHGLAARRGFRNTF